MKNYKLLLGDNIESLKNIPDNSIDSCVTDPPYGLSFMCKKWDYDVPSVELWKEVYRILKPGGHILSFGGTRTYHRMVINIEDAGFEIRDQLQWIYGSGFPKSLNIGKAIDKIQGNEREIIGEYKIPDIKDRNYITAATKKQELILTNITKGNTKYEGWGTALKPANEPICLARKPISEKTIALNVLKWGTGGINIDGSRVGIEGATKRDRHIQYLDRSIVPFSSGHKVIETEGGRFPANIILDEQASEILDGQSGISKGNKPGNIRKGSFEFCSNYEKEETPRTGFNDKGGASRFFYCAKVSSKERNLGCEELEDIKLEDNIIGANGRKKRPDGSIIKDVIRKNNHPTVKPISLMSYLCKLITPPGGYILDPFMGSGSTGIAALLNDFKFIGCEMDENYMTISENRIKNWEKYK